MVWRLSASCKSTMLLLNIPALVWIRTMVSQLVQYERIETTVARAKELRRLADRIVTWSKEVGVLA